LSNVISKNIFRVILLLHLFSFKPTKSFAQNNEIKRIVLTWNSFKRTTNPNLPYIAYTAHKTLYKYRAIQRKNTISLRFEVGIMLDTPNTMVNYNRLNTLTKSAQNELLLHEQGHTDLAVIYGRLLFRELSSKTYSPIDFKNKTRAIYLKLMKDLAEENSRYDTDTEHGFNAEEQKKWAATIKTRLSTT
jgi:hypothetical protein